MAVDGGAGSGQPDKTGSGAPDGGSPEGGSENDDKPITAKQLKAALESQKRHYEGQLENQRAEFSAFKEGVGKQQAPAQAAPKVYTKADLKAAVDGAQITLEQADDIWDRQRETQIRESAKADALDAVKGQATKERVDTDLKSYKRLKPEIMQRGSELREQVTTEYQALVDRGSPETTATELAAIRSVLGPLEKLEKSAGASRALETEEQGGSGGDGKPNGGSDKSGLKLVDQLSARQKAHYQRGIDSKRYKDWKEVEAELKYSPSRIGRR